MNGRDTRPTNGQDLERPSPLSLQHAAHGEPGRNTAVRRRPAAERSAGDSISILATIARLGEANLRQLEYMLAIDQTTLTRSLNLLERDRLIERVPHPEGASR